MRIYRFTVKEHPEYGMGFAPNWYPTGEPFGGMAAAHDVLEHFPKDDGSTEGELMALGASMLVRADGGWSNKYRHFNEIRDCSSDFPQIIAYHMDREQGRELRRAPRCQCSQTRDRAAAIIAEARRLVRAEDIGEDFTEEDWEQAARWIAHGYQKARNRYRNIYVPRLAGLFMQIERGLDALLNGDVVEGQTVLVRLNLSAVSATVEAEYPNDW